MDDGLYAARATVVEARFVTREQLADLAEWIGGTTWAAGVRVPTDRGELHARIGEVITRNGPWVSVYSASRFAATHSPFEGQI